LLFIPRRIQTPNLFIRKDGEAVHIIIYVVQRDKGRGTEIASVTVRDCNLDTCGVRDDGTVKGWGTKTDLPTVYNISSEYIGH
jgi:hypothetical protein